MDTVTRSLADLTDEELAEVAWTRYGVHMMLQVSGAQYSTQEGARRASRAHAKYIEARIEQRRRAA